MSGQAESLKGVGEIYAGDVLLRAIPYTLSVVPASGGGEAKIDGRIDITGIGEAVVLVGAEGLTLKLADGRRLPFKLTDTGGTIVGTAPLE